VLVAQRMRDVPTIRAVIEGVNCPVCLLKAAQPSGAVCAAIAVLQLQPATPRRQRVAQTVLCLHYELERLHRRAQRTVREYSLRDGPTPCRSFSFRCTKAPVTAHLPGLVDEGATDRDALAGVRSGRAHNDGEDVARSQMLGARRGLDATCDATSN
jgi:hypothetical protein